VSRKVVSSMKEPIECPHCGRFYRADKISKCPGCASGSSGISSNPKTEGIHNNSNVNTSPPKIESFARRTAIESARIVNGYGTFIQVIGVVVGVIIIIGGFLLAASSSSPVFAVLGIAFGILDIAIFLVQGALFRMLSNYVIARLE